MSDHATYNCRQHPEEDALQLGPRKKPCLSDPLIHHGRHFGRTEYAFCSIRVLLQNGLHRTAQLVDDVRETFTAHQKREYRVYRSLVHMIPGLEERIMASSKDELCIIADLIQKGVSSARSDDTKSLKGVAIDWITPPEERLDPPLSRNIKTDRGFNHHRTGYLLCPAGLDWSDIELRQSLRDGLLQISSDQWPIFLYHECLYDPDDPWKGLFRNSILISAYKHIFTSPSSVGKEPKATRSGNAIIHGMTSVTLASIAYVATQVRFSLTSSSVFSRTDKITDSEGFYTSILDLLEDPEEAAEVHELLKWWNRKIFPYYGPIKHAPAHSTVLAKIRAKRAAAKAQAAAAASPTL